MPRYRLTIAYDGTGFCGWQKQEPLAHTPDSPRSENPPAYSTLTPLVESDRPGRVALRTVQAVVESAVRQVVRQPVELIGASRTDSGVHARGQVAAFTCGPTDLDPALSSQSAPPATLGSGWPADRGPDRLAAAINSRLPDDVLVLDAALAAPTFDPIGDCTSKAYSYTFHLGRRRPLWDRALVHHVWQASALNIPAMQAAAATLVGEHDFAAFAAAGHGRQTTIRRVLALGVSELPAVDGADQRVRIDIAGSGFLWNMVRIIAGTLLEVGLGRRTPDEVRATLESRDRTRAGPTAPPTGLCLEWVRYDTPPPSGSTA